MKIIWDEPKRLANLEKHGMDFAELEEAFFENALVVPAKGKRWLGIGVNLNGVITVVFARYGREAISIISMRPASFTERELFRGSL